jgi:ABC-type dipeptide/oligopeptide/nickel transport system permease component
MGLLIAGAVVTEVVFEWKGIGSLLTNAVLSRDYPTVEGAVFVSASAVLLGTFIGDLLQTKMDPRIEESA